MFGRLSELRAAAREQAAPLIEELARHGYEPIYGCVVGSYAYGTQTEDSDLDVRLVVMRPSDYVLSGRDEESFRDHNSDTVAYTMDKFVRLLANGSPNIVDMVGIPESMVFLIRPEFNYIRKNLPLLASKRIGSAYLGYAKSAMHRLDGSMASSDPNVLAKRSKDMMHVLRAVEAGTHILRTGEVRASVTPPEVLCDIRNGKYILPDLGWPTMGYRLAYNVAVEALQEAHKQSTLPPWVPNDTISGIIAYVNGFAMKKYMEGRYYEL